MPLGILHPIYAKYVFPLLHYNDIVHSSLVDSLNYQGSQAQLYNEIHQQLIKLQHKGWIPMNQQPLLDGNDGYFDEETCNWDITEWRNHMDDQDRGDDYYTRNMVCNPCDKRDLSGYEPTQSELDNLQDTINILGIIQHNAIQLYCDYWRQFCKRIHHEHQGPLCFVHKTYNVKSKTRILYFYGFNQLYLSAPVATMIDMFQGMIPELSRDIEEFQRLIAHWNFMHWQNNYRGHYYIIMKPNDSIKVMRRSYTLREFTKWLHHKNNTIAYSAYQRRITQGQNPFTILQNSIYACDMKCVSNLGDFDIIDHFFSGDFEYSVGYKTKRNSYHRCQQMVYQDSSMWTCNDSKCSWFNRLITSPKQGVLQRF